jgi:hypothetical protein
MYCRKIKVTRTIYGEQSQVSTRARYYQQRWLCNTVERLHMRRSVVQKVHALLEVFALELVLPAQAGVQLLTQTVH